MSQLDRELVLVGQPRAAALASIQAITSCRSYPDSPERLVARAAIFASIQASISSATHATFAAESEIRRGNLFSTSQARSVGLEASMPSARRSARVSSRLLKRCSGGAA